MNGARSTRSAHCALLVDLLHRRAARRRGRTSAAHTTHVRHATTARTLVDLHHDRVHDTLETCQDRQMNGARSTRSAHCALLVDLLHRRAARRRGRTSAAHATHVRHATTDRTLVDLHHDRVHDTLDLLLLRLELVALRHLVAVQPVERLLDGLLDLVLVVTLELVLQLLLLQRVAHRVAVVLQAVLRLDLLLVRLILRSVLL